MRVFYSDIEFTIENFSYWRYEIHGSNIPLPRRNLNNSNDEAAFLELFPRGDSGSAEHLVVRFCHEWFFGDVEISFIGPDGFPIKTELMNIKEYRSEFCIGPEYDKLIAGIRETEPFHKDLLTLRFRKKSIRVFRCHVQISIDVLYTSIKINSKIFKEYYIEKDAWNCISTIHYPLDKGNKERLEFHAFKIDSQSKTNVTFRVSTDDFRSTKALAKISLFHQLGKGAIVKFQDLEHIFTGKSEHVYFNSLPINEDAKRDFYIILRLKIITDKAIKSHSHVTSFYPCEIETDFTNSSTAPSLHPDASVDVHRKELACLYQDRDFSDFQLRCGQSSFPVHKGILSARSPVFKEMLSIHLRKEVSGLMDIQDLDPATLDLFLGFLYSSKVDDLQVDTALKLYYAADKYQVPTLKRECVTVLCDEVSISNICEILSLANKYRDSKLTSVANCFLLKNFDRICRTDEWINFWQGRRSTSGHRSEALHSADEYQVPTLKRECVTVLLDEVSISNICEILSLANKYRDGELASVANGFLLKNFDRICRTEEWINIWKGGRSASVHCSEALHSADKSQVLTIKMEFDSSM